MSNIQAEYERPYAILAPDGTLLWQGAAVPGVVYRIRNNEASAAIGVGEAVRQDTGVTINMNIPRWDFVATDAAAISSDIAFTVLGGLRVSAVANINWWGVALEPIAAGKSGLVGGPGTICCVKSVASGSITSNTRGGQVIGTATAGAVNALAAVAAGSVTTAADNQTLGRVLLIAGTTGPGTDTGSATQLGIMVTCSRL